MEDVQQLVSITPALTWLPCDSETTLYLSHSHGCVTHKAMALDMVHIHKVKIQVIHKRVPVHAVKAEGEAE